MPPGYIRTNAFAHSSRYFSWISLPFSQSLFRLVGHRLIDCYVLRQLEWLRNIKMCSQNNNLQKQHQQSHRNFLRHFIPIKNAVFKMHIKNRIATVLPSASFAIGMAPFYTRVNLPTVRGQHNGLVRGFIPVSSVTYPLTELYLKVPIIR